MTINRSLFPLFALLGTLLILGLLGYVFVGNTSSKRTDDAAYGGTEKAAGQAGATVTPTAPPSQVEPK